MVNNTKQRHTVPNILIYWAEHYIKIQGPSWSWS